MKYSVIIPTRNNCDQLLKPCVESVLTYTAMTDMELIVVAHDCTDNTKYYLERVKHQFHSMGFENNFKVIWHTHALSFMQACEQGISHSTCDKIVLLNSQVRLLPQPKHDWIHKLTAPFDTDSHMGVTYWMPSGNSADLDPVCVMIKRSTWLQLYNLSVLEPSHHTYLSWAPQAGWTSNNVTDIQIDMHMWPPSTQSECVPHTAACEHHGAVAEKYNWLEHSSKEAAGLFKEVIVQNSYELTADLVKDRVVVDVGANTGMFSILAAALGAKQVLSYEPSDKAYGLLHQNVHNTDIAHKIHTHKQAVVGLPQSHVHMWVNDDSNFNSLYVQGESQEQVPAVTFSQLMQHVCESNVMLKMDCEGAEYDILLNTPDHVFDKISYLMVEIHGDMHPEYKGLSLAQNRILNLGFRLLSRKPFGIWWYQNNQPIKFEPMNITIETWSKS